MALLIVLAHSALMVYSRLLKEPPAPHCCSWGARGAFTSGYRSWPGGSALNSTLHAGPGTHLYPPA